MPEIAAAGGVLLARAGQGRTKMAVIHRPKYMDWSLPKGKLEEGESWTEAALREVEEETGYRCEPIAELPHVSYLDRKARRKLVRYWLSATRRPPPRTTIGRAPSRTRSRCARATPTIGARAANARPR